MVLCLATVLLRVILLTPNRQSANSLDILAWKAKCGIATQLGRYHDHVSFAVLTWMMKDADSDVSYIAAESIESRKDTNFDLSLTKSINGLERENRWPVYQAMKSYPSAVTVKFLVESLDEECRFYKKLPNFDEQNCFYIIKSLESISKNFPAIAGVKTLDVRGLSDYEQCLKEYKQRIRSSNTP
jgi:hypothetical protein